MTTRRTILGAAVAAPIMAGAIPALAQESLAARVLRHREVLINNVRNHIANTIVSGSSRSSSDSIISINERMIDRHPDLFVHQPMT
jgi:hypothetical protein